MHGSFRIFILIIFSFTSCTGGNESRETESSTIESFTDEVVEQDSHRTRKVGRKSRSPPDVSVLPKNHSDKLLQRIKKLVAMWAEEEQMNGNKVFCKLEIFLDLLTTKLGSCSFRRKEFNDHIYHLF